MKRIAVFLIFAILAVTISPQLSSQTENGPVSLRYTLGSTYYLVERANWSQYVNGAYIGLTHRETRANVTAAGNTANGLKFTGFFYVLEETLRDMTHSARGLDEIRETSFTISPDGRMRFLKDSGYPELREFPVYPEKPVLPGDRWQAEGKRIVDPRNDGKKTALPIMVEYEYIGGEMYHDRAVNRLRAKYATRINKYLKNKTDDPDLKDATGTHDVEILVDAETGSAILILDRLDETFFYTDGGSIRFRGSTALFTEAPVPIDHATLSPKIASIAQKAGESAKDAFPTPSGKKAPAPKEDSFSGFSESSSGSASATTPLAASEPISPPPIAAKDNAERDPFTVEETPQGIRLSVRDIRFLPDSDGILPEEAWRLDAIAETLKLVPQGKFLVEGHTASVGKPEGEKTLSVARAQKIVAELSKRGLLPEQFMFSGYGGSKPIADNATQSGRAQNRRVEITILE